MLTSVITATDSCYLSKENTGLGNIMFQISSTIGLANTCSKKYHFPYISILLNKLNNMGLNDRESTVFRNISTKTIGSCVEIEESRSEGFDPSLEQKIKICDVNICLKNYLQSHLYFNKYRELILNIFSIDINSRRYIDNKYPELKDNICISIHVRQKYGGDVLYDIDDYMKMIDYIRNTVPVDPLFVVCSDNIEWCKQNFPSNFNIIFIQDNPDYIDMWIMSLCQHNIICHSTIGWWGAYLNNNKGKIVVYPEKALRRKALKIHKNKVWEYRETEYYMPEWVCL